MAIADLMTNLCTILRRFESGDEDRYGNDQPDETSQTGVACELQQETRQEPGEGGEVSDDRWRLFLPAGTDFKTGDAVIVDGVEYEALGDPWSARNPIDQAEHHVECTVRRTAGAEDAS